MGLVMFVKDEKECGMHCAVKLLNGRKDYSLISCLYQKLLGQVRLIKGYWYMSDYGVQIMD